MLGAKGPASAPLTTSSGRGMCAGRRPSEQIVAGGRAAPHPAWLPRRACCGLAPRSAAGEPRHPVAGRQL